MRNLYPAIFWTIVCCCLFIAPKSVPALAQGLKFPQDSINLGTITEDDSARTYSFCYENTSQQPIKITKVETTCSCIRPEYPHEAILPGEKGKIRITFIPMGRAGKLHRAIHFYTTDVKEHPSFQLILCGEVLPSSDPYIDYPYAMGGLRLMQSTVNFGEISGDRKRMESVQVVNASDKNLKISTEGLPDYIEFYCHPSPLAPRQVADLVFIVNPRKCAQKGCINLQFYLNGIGNVNPLQRTMEIKGRLK